MGLETGIKKTMLISPEQDSRLKYYCKKNCISASQLFRLIIDELSISQYDYSLKDNIQTTAFKTNQFISPNKNVLKEIINDGNGNLQTRWYGRSAAVSNSFPDANHP